MFQSLRLFVMTRNLAPADIKVWRWQVHHRLGKQLACDSPVYSCSRLESQNLDVTADFSFRCASRRHLAVAVASNKKYGRAQSLVPDASY